MDIDAVKILDNADVRARFVSEVNAQKGDADVIILPAVFGLKNSAVAEDVRKALGIKTLILGTLPPSVPGIRSQMQLKEAFVAAGGTFLKGDEATGARFEGGKVAAVSTVDFGDIDLTAENYVLATGSYFGHGLISGVDSVTEPVFGSDVIFDADREKWYDKDFFSKQGFIGFGVATDADFHVMKDGKAVENLYAAGSVLGGFNPLYEGCGAGVAIMTAFHISESILGR